MTSEIKELTQFDQARNAIVEIKSKLSNFILTDQGSRDKLFNLCKDAASWRKRVDQKRLELIRPISDELKDLKEDYEAAREPLTQKKKDIDEYAKTQLLDPLNGTIDVKKKQIIEFDKEAEKVREKERLRMEKEKKDKEEKERKKQEEIDRKAREKQEKIDREKRENDEKLKGIAKKKADKEAAEKQRKADEDKRQEQEKLDKEAADRRKADEEKEKELNKKISGRVKVTRTFTIQNELLVPDDFIIRTVDKKKVQAAIDLGVDSIPGILIETHEELKQK